MKTGWKLAVLALAVVLGPRVVTGDAVLVPGAGPTPLAVATGARSLSLQPAASVRSSASSERAPGRVQVAEMSAGPHGSESASMGLPTKRNWGIPRRWKFMTRSQAGGSEAVRPHPRGLGTPRVTERPVALHSQGAEGAPAALQQPLELLGGKQPAEQEALSEVAPQGP